MQFTLRILVCTCNFIKGKRKKKHFWNSCELTNHGHLGSKLFSSQSSNTFPLQFQPPVKVKYVNHILFSENLYVSNGEGNGTPFQYSCLENPMDGGAWWAAVYGVTQSQTQLKRLSSSSSSALPAVTFFSLSVIWMRHLKHRKLSYDHKVVFKK